MISHHLRILDLALASLGHHKGRHLCIVTIYAFEVFVLASALFMAQALKREALTLLADSPALIVQKMSGGRHSLIPLDTADTIAGLPGVRRVTPRFWGYYYDPPTQANFTFSGAGLLTPGLGEMVAGSIFNPDDHLGCVIGQGVADLRLLDVGDLLPVKGDDGNLYALQVSGIFRADSRLLTNDLVVLSDDNLRRIFQIPAGMATDLAVEVPNREEIETVAKKIMSRLNAVRVISRDRTLRTYEAVFSWRSGLLLLAFAGSLAAFGVLAWDRASGLSSEEKKTIGVLRGLGWEVGEVLEFKLWEGLAISGLSFLIGLTAAYLHVYYFGCGLFSPIMQGWSVLFPSLQLTPRLEPFTLMVVFFLSVLPYTFATLIPCWSVSVTDPDQAMRG